MSDKKKKLSLDKCDDYCAEFLHFSIFEGDEDQP